MLANNFNHLTYYAKIFSTFMVRKIIIGVMGPGENATNETTSNAYRIGELIAQQGWVLLTGGRNTGVMEAASLGAKDAGGLTIGILPDRDAARMSEAVDLAIITDLGNARNNINVLSSEVVIACGLGLGTVSEVALALKNRKPVILLGDDDHQAFYFFANLAPKEVFLAASPEEAVEIVKCLLKCE